MANRTLGRNQNLNDTAVITDFVLNATTSVKISDASDPDACRLFFHISNTGNIGVYIKLQAASVDNDKKGIYIPAGEDWSMPLDNIYTGEISAIAAVNGPTISVTEY